MYLTEREFKQLVRVQAGVSNVPLEIADRIADIFARWGCAGHEQVSAATDVARYFAAHDRAMQKSNLRSVLAKRALKFATTEVVLHGQHLEKRVRPYVEQLRRRYFGSVKVPFASYDQAVLWMRQQVAVKPPPARGELLRWHADMHKAMQQFPDEFDVEYSIGEHAILLLAPKPGAVRGKVGFAKGTGLENLKQVTESMANGTGCDVALCVAHVLTGTPLIRDPLDWGLEFFVGCGLSRRTAWINIAEPHVVTLPMLMKTYRHLREKLGLLKKKMLTGRHERLLKLVRKHGGVPRHGKTQFWQAVQRDLNKAVPRGGRRYETWMGPKMAYDRLQAALRRDALATKLNVSTPPR
jgi:hypothetical protein